MGLADDIEYEPEDFYFGEHQEVEFRIRLDYLKKCNLWLAREGKLVSVSSMDESYIKNVMKFIHSSTEYNDTALAVYNYFENVLRKRK